MPANIITNQVYDKLVYSKGKITYHDYVTNKLDNVHNVLFDDALYKYFDKIYHFDKSNTTYELVKAKYRIIDIKHELYFEPSIVKLINLKELTTKTINLESYWDNTYIIQNVFLNYSVKPVSNNFAEYRFMLSDGTDIPQQDTTNIKNAIIYDAEIIEWDYVRGRAKLRSRLWGTEFYVDYKYTNSNIKESSDLSLNNTFTELYIKYNK